MFCKPGPFLIVNAYRTLAVLLICGCLNLSAQAQINTDNRTNAQYIEGAKLVIDILKLFKSENKQRKEISTQKNDALSNACDFCLYNSDSLNKIKVTLIARETHNPDTIFLVIRSRDKACSLRIKCGVYNCKIQTAWDDVISWGDVYINEKSFLLKK